MRHSRVARNIWLGIENLLLHKLRTFLTMLGVVFGVGSVVAMLSVGEGASQEALDQIRKIGSNNIIITEDEGHLIAVIGLENMVVAHSPDATLVCPVDQTDRLKELLEAVRKHDGEKFL